MTEQDRKLEEMFAPPRDWSEDPCGFGSPEDGLTCFCAVALSVVCCLFVGGLLLV